MKNIYIIGDCHWKRKEPYRSALIRMFKEVFSDPENTILIFTGDLLDSSTVHTEDVLDVVLEILSRFAEVHIVSGNHELNKIKGNILKPINRFPNIFTYRTPRRKNIEGIKFLFLPFLPSIIKMQYFYPKIKRGADYCVCHFSPPESNFKKKEEFAFPGIDIDNIEAIKVYGHNHRPNKFNVLGVPQMTRMGEQDWSRRIMKVNGPQDFEFIPIPNFIEVEEIIYGEEPKSKDNIIIVKQAPSQQAINQRYADYYVSESHCGFETIEGEISIEDQVSVLNTNLIDNFRTFVIGREVSVEVQNKALAYLSQNAEEIESVS